MGGCNLTVLAKKQGGLQVTSNKEFAVYLEDLNLGQTPFFNEKILVGDYNLKLVPQSPGASPWQTRITINQSTLTVVRFEAEDGSEKSSSLIMQLEKLDDKTQTQLSITSLPDNVAVRIDGELKGTTPLMIDKITAGDHAVTLETPGYVKKAINAKTSSGYLLKIQAQLALEKLQPINTPQPSVGNTEGIKSDEEASVAAEATLSGAILPSPDTSKLWGKQVNGITVGARDQTALEKPFVMILPAQADVDWLRVRSAPVSGQNEVAKVKVGSYFPATEKTEDGFIKIEYEPGKWGFIVSSYAKVYGELSLTSK